MFRQRRWTVPNRLEILVPRVSAFKSFEADADHMAEEKQTFVEEFDVVEGLCSGHFPSLGCRFTKQLLRQAAEEGLWNNTRAAIAASMHAGLQVVFAPKAF